MSCLFNRLTHTFTATAVLGCCGLLTFTSGAALLADETNPDNGAEHRGSGRLYTEVSPTSNADFVLAHRGSGRIDNETAEADATAYRGSGRITTEVA